MSQYELELHINCTLEFDSAAERDAAKSAINTELAKHNLPDGFIIPKDNVPAYDSKGVALGVDCEVINSADVIKYTKPAEVVAEP